MQPYVSSEIPEVLFQPFGYNKTVTILGDVGSSCVYFNLIKSPKVKLKILNYELLYVLIIHII